MKYLQTLFWFIRRPQYLPYILSVAKRKRNKEKEETSAESTALCEEVSISQKDLFCTLYPSLPFINVFDKHPDIIKHANFREQSCPVKMGGQGAFNLIYNLALNQSGLNFFETGVAYGWSTLAILLGIKDTSENGKLTSNDMPYIKKNNDDWVGCIIPNSLKLHWTLLRHPDSIGIPKALKSFKNGIDFVHYDSDKSYTGRMWSAPLLWAKLNSGGLFISDDINDNTAFFDFCKSENLNPLVTEHEGKFVGVVKKPL